MSGHVVLDIQTQAEGSERIYITDTNVKRKDFIVSEKMI